MNEQSNSLCTKVVAKKMEKCSQSYIMKRFLFIQQMDQRMLFLSCIHFWHDNSYHFLLKCACLLWARAWLCWCSLPLFTCTLITGSCWFHLVESKHLAMIILICFDFLSCHHHFHSRQIVVGFTVVHQMFGCISVINEWVSFMDWLICWIVWKVWPHFILHYTCDIVST